MFASASCSIQESNPKKRSLGMAGLGSFSTADDGRTVLSYASKTSPITRTTPCANGLMPQTNIYFDCGTENIVISASEDTTNCYYNFEMAGPAACAQPSFTADSTSSSPNHHKSDSSSLLKTTSFSLWLQVSLSVLLVLSVIGHL
ncbi:hypothetical protein DFA_05052 [Cavenderia fasciculata]|uniref:MRH domain-containing protein n=1 Tax=Cavenderia fasciculata TaxID=261658 RepID=F4PN69_CACFS|nr:uncharacterized protein DFA_05052 [Cavenderia fasciculata]EGG22922.1 hypothetical protein DFA_05052 [Cavenderia fasciculata]|eukprot:XP_004360773.1 hypothetical protein DFA_05052 [Cavenderia fasciculata]